MKLASVHSHSPYEPFETRNSEYPISGGSPRRYLRSSVTSTIRASLWLAR